MKRKRKENVPEETIAEPKAPPRLQGYERQLAVEKLMAQMQHQALVNPEGPIHYGVSEDLSDDDGDEDLVFFRIR